MKSTRLSRKLFLTLVCAGALLAATDWQKTDPGQWTSDDVYQILNNSPWSKSVKTTVTNARDPNDQLGNESPHQTAPPNGGGTWGNSGQMPGMGGAGRRGGYGNGGYGNGGYGTGGYGGRSAGSGRPNANSDAGTQVTIQWQSALPVQIAAAKKADPNADITNINPVDEYVIAVIGLPVRALGGRAASIDTDQTTDEDESKALEARLKQSTELLASGHEAIHPTKVALNQGADGRILLSFPKTDPITIGEKTVEFRLVAGRTEIRKKFNLKEMEYHGKLEL
jgi:hypothetical protein